MGSKAAADRATIWEDRVKEVAIDSQLDVTRGHTKTPQERARQLSQVLRG